MSLFTIAGNDTEHAQWGTDHRPAAHALAARPIREMTLDYRTLWSVRFCVVKGHFCSLLLSNILVTSAFCRLTVPSFFSHSTFPDFITFVPLCGMLLQAGTKTGSTNRLTVSSETSGIRYLWLLSTTSALTSSFRKNGGRKSFSWKGAFLLWLYSTTGFPFFQVTILYKLSNYHLYKTDILVIITRFSVDYKRYLC